MELFITGHKSGLGKYLVEKSCGKGIDPRITKSVDSELPKVIIHCGYKYPSTVSMTDALSQLEQAKESLRVLLDLNNLQKFIYISSVDVYPNFTDFLYDESTVVDLREIRGIHCFTKLALEEYITKNSRNFLILRPGLMLGKYSRENSITRILSRQISKISLSSESTFNVVSHDSIQEFISLAMSMNLEGLYNLNSSATISLGSVAAMADNSQIEFGKVLYRTPNVNNSKVLEICKSFSKTSREFLEEFIEVSG
jgi:nucleoside-diphosphate-sugar epimerase